MKIRNGFVSNSSSSSFVCDICGDSYEGWDGDYGDITEFVCINNHSMCSNCCNLQDTFSFEELVAYYNKFKDEGLDEEYKDDIESAIQNNDKDLLYELLIVDGDFDRYDLDAELCPCCRLEIVADREMINYLLARVEMDANEVRADIKKRFKNVEELRKFCGQYRID